MTFLQILWPVYIPLVLLMLYLAGRSAMHSLQKLVRVARTRSGSRAARLAASASDLAGRCAGQSPELPREMAMIGKPGLQCNLRQREIGADQQLVCALDAPL